MQWPPSTQVFASQVPDLTSEPSSSSRATRLGDTDGRPSADVRQAPRVCDNCIRQKVKCDLGRPRCNRCSDRGIFCTYSLIRRKPGPAPGFKRGSQRGSQRGWFPLSRPNDSYSEAMDRQSKARELRDLEEDVLPLPPPDFALTPPLTQRSGASETSVANPGSGDGEQQADPLHILPEEEEYLLNKYFETIHDAIPLFSMVRSPLSGGALNCSRDFISTLIIITAKLTGFTFASDGLDLDAHIDRTLTSVPLQEDICGDSPTLDQFRKFCLLAFYEFHQFPGHQAWMRIGKLVRIAYWIGLDRLDGRRASSPDWSRTSEDEVEGWRLAWWCVYRLDSYANLSFGTPYEIDERLVNTALVGDQQADQALSLPYQPEGLLELLAAVTSDPQRPSLFNLHIISTTALRYTGRMLRLHSLAREDQFTTALRDAERHLSVLRLALPKNFFNPKRNALMNEPHADHNARLVMALHFLMAQLITALASCRFVPEGDDWLLSWQHVLEVCQNIAAMAMQWNDAFSTNVDPAVSLIGFTALIFLDLHKKAVGAAADANLQSEIKHCETVLLLQLEQFAGMWTLPGLLIREYS